MSDKQAILDAATEVGLLLKDSDAVTRLKSAAKAFQDDVTAQRTVVDFNRFLQTLAQKESQGQPIEVADKRKLTELQDAVAGDPQLRFDAEGADGLRRPAAGGRPVDPVADRGGRGHLRRGLRGVLPPAAG